MRDDLASRYGRPPGALRQGSFGSPASCNTITQHLCVHTQSLGPICRAESDTIMRKHDILVRIAILHGGCRPTNIVRFIVAIIIDAIKGVALFAAMREGGNILVKCLKRLRPRQVDFYSTPAIPRIFMMAGVKTPLFHALPAFIRWMFSEAMSSICRTRAFFVKATTRLGSLFSPQNCTFHCCFVATVAAAGPKNSPVAIASNGGKDCQASESLSHQIFCFEAKSDMLGIHRNLSFLCLIRGRVNSTLPGLFMGFFSFILAHLVEHRKVEYASNA